MPPRKCLILYFSLMLAISLPCKSALAEKKPSRSVKPAELKKLIEKADKIVVYANEMQPDTVLFSSSERKYLDELNSALEVEPGAGVFCACIGAPIITLFRQGSEIGHIANQSGHAIHTSLWAPDGLIKDQEKWLHWFDARGISGPRQQVEEEAALEKQSVDAEQRWIKAMPASMRQPWTKFQFDVTQIHPDLKPLTVALAKEVPDQHERVRALLQLFGSGAGPWSGFPWYESVVEQMLMEYSTADLLAATTEGMPLTEQQTEGAARLFGGWEFNNQRPQDGKLIPPELRRTLLEHSLKSSDQDKLARAKSAFGP